MGRSADAQTARGVPSLAPPVYPGRDDPEKLHEWRKAWGAFWGANGRKVRQLIEATEGRR